MKLDFGNEKSIYLQIAESIEDDILRGILHEEEQLPSTNQLAALLKINPATAGKGINLLVDEGTVYKKRGIGMFVATGACEKLRTKRKNAFYETYIINLLHEAKNLGLTHSELFALLEKGEKEHG